MRDYGAIKEALTFYAATSETTRKTRALLDAADAIEELVARVPDKNVGEWVSVEERLPRKYENVITADKHGYVQWNYLLNAKHNTWSTGYHITHWMPLPKAPKEVSQHDD